MTVWPIIVQGDPVLHRRAEEVTDFGPALRTLVADMWETMLAAPGVGLAAPQIGVGLRVFIWRYEGGHSYDTAFEGDPVLGEASRSGVVINPTLELSQWRDGRLDKEAESEGCLSFPGYDYPLRRADRAVLSGMGLEGEPLRIEACGWLARIFQHEFDHLEGMLYVDRLASPYDHAAQRTSAREGWGQPGLSWQPSGGRARAQVRRAGTARTPGRSTRRGPAGMRLAGS